MVEPDLAVQLSDVVVFEWGVLLRVCRTKTISFKERVLTIPFVKIPTSIFCVYKCFHLLSLLVLFQSGHSQLI